MALKSSLEIERKYDVEETLELPDLAAIGPVREDGTAILRAVYFDTADNVLAENLTVLRRRSGGGDEGWHVKRPGDAGGRAETHAPLGDASHADVPPDEIVDVVRELIGNRPLQPIARLTTDRATLTVLSDEGSALAAVTDDVVSATDVRRGILRVWREWEVELSEDLAQRPDDGALLLDRIEKILLTAGAEPARSASKLARALGRTSLAAAPSQPDTHQPDTHQPDPDRSDAATQDPRDRTALEVSNSILGDLLDRLENAEPSVRSDDDDSVHAMRIVVRRVRGVLAAFRGVWDADRIRALRAQLRQLGDVLGAARDAEVRGIRARALLEQDTFAAGDADARRRLVDDQHGEYEAHRTELVQFLDSADYATVMSELRELQHAPPTTELAGEPARPALRKVLRREQRRSTRRLAHADRSDLDALHAARKAARRLRYVAEALSDGETPVLGAKVRSLAEAAERVQDVLGNHRDATLFLDRLAEASTQATEAGENGAVYTSLKNTERGNSRDALAEVDAAEKDLARAAQA